MNTEKCTSRNSDVPQPDYLKIGLLDLFPDGFEAMGEPCPDTAAGESAIASIGVTDFLTYIPIIFIKYSSEYF